MGQHFDLGDLGYRRITVGTFKAILSDAACALRAWLWFLQAKHEGNARVIRWQVDQMTRSKPDEERPVAKC
jgi:hypothetical protein